MSNLISFAIFTFYFDDLLEDVEVFEGLLPLPPPLLFPVLEGIFPPVLWNGLPGLLVVAIIFFFRLLPTRHFHA